MKALFVLFLTTVLFCPLSQAQIDQSTWRFEPIWTIGGDDGDVFFSQIEHVVVGKDGTVYIHENRISTVRMFTPEGKEIGEFGSKGKAPGEFEDISNMYVAPNGNLFLSDFMQGRISEVTSNGKHLRVISAPPVVQYRSPILGNDLKNDQLAVLFKNSSSTHDVGKLFYTLDLETSAIGLPTADPMDILTEKDPVYEWVKGKYSAYRATSFPMKDGSILIYVAPWHYNGKSMRIPFKEGKFGSPQVFNVQKGFETEHAKKLDVSREEFSTIIRSGKLGAAGSFNGPEGSLFVDMISTALGFIQLSETQFGIYFNTEQVDPAQAYIDVFDAQKGHIGRHKIEYPGIDSIGAPQLHATSTQGEYYVTHYTEDRTPLVSKMKLIRN